ncbi:MAG: zinc-binding dehydrogenase [Limnochordia bacterium]|jgi:threonine 3-dehydrogenase
MMRALMKNKPEAGAQVVEIPVPQPGPNELLVKIEKAAICGSDGHVYRWRANVHSLVSLLPFTMGHEFCGQVVDKGANVTGFEIGDLVCGETHVPCLVCSHCQTGQAHICPQMGLIGRSVDGCFAEYMVLPTSAAWKLAPGISPEFGALMEPLGVAVHAIDEGCVSGKTVIVMGCGSIGLMAIRVAKLLGAVQVIGISRTPSKLDLAAQLGADLTINSAQEDPLERIRDFTGGEMADVLIEMSGDPQAFTQGLSMLRAGGQVVAVGNPPEPFAIDVLGQVILREITISGIFGRKIFHTWLLAQKLVQTGQMDMNVFLSETFPLEDHAAAFELAAQVPQRVLFDPGLRK